MSPHETTAGVPGERGPNIALIFALLAERLRAHYEHHIWLKQAQCASLAAEWLARNKRTLPLQLRKDFSDLSEQLARQITESTSREAGLYISHELQEALDPRYYSEVGQTMMLECERMFDEYCKLNNADPDGDASDKS